MDSDMYDAESFAEEIINMERKKRFSLRQMMRVIRKLVEYQDNVT